MAELPNKETLTVEFKSDRKRLPDDDLVTTAVAMANTEGGVIYLGMEDDGTVTGLHSAHQPPEGIAALVENRTVPSVQVRIETLAVAGKTIAKISVPKVNQVVATTAVSYFKRRLKHDGSPESVPILPHDIPARLSQMGAVACQMAAAVFDQTVIEIDAGRVGLRANGQVMRFAGYLAIYAEAQDEASPDDEAAGSGAPDGECGAVTVIQRANSDLRLNPHFHVLQLDGVYAPGRDGGAPIFHPAPGLTPKDIEAIVERASKRILRFVQRRGVITLVTAPGEGAREARGVGGWRGGPEVPEGGDAEVTVVADETMGEKDPLLANLLAAATSGAPPAGPANKRKPIRIVLDPDDRPVAKGNLCGQHAGFNLHAATRVAVPRDFGTDSPPHPPQQVAGLRQKPVLEPLPCQVRVDQFHPVQCDDEAAGEEGIDDSVKPLHDASSPVVIATGLLVETDSMAARAISTARLPSRREQSGCRS
jgi:hypothetical protein